MARRAVKQRRKLQNRIADWEAIKGESGSTDKKKTVHKPCGAILSFTKPGSNKK